MATARPRTGSVAGVRFSPSNVERTLMAPFTTEPSFTIPTGWLGLRNPSHHAPDGQPADVVVVIEVVDEDLERSLGIARRDGDVLEDRFEERSEGR